MNAIRRPHLPRGAALVAAAALAALSTAASSVPFPALAAEPPVVTFEGQLRLRYEYRSPLDYRLPGTSGRPGTDRLRDRGDALFLRSRLGVRAWLPASRVRLHLELQDARTMGTESSTLANTDNVDAHQAYAELDSLGGAPLALQLGRFEMVYGDARLLGNGDWSPNGRSFDGARARWRPGPGRVDAFVTWLGEGRRAGSDRMFGGVIAGITRKGADAAWTLDLDGYGFLRDLGDTVVAGESGVKGDLQDRTFGGRLRLAAGIGELRLEGAGQTGERAGDDVSAWAFAARADVVVTEAPRLKLFAEYATASGDETPGDGDWGRFDPLYPTAHGLLGYSDLAAWQNIADVSGGVAFEPRRGLSFEAAVHRFTLAEARDAWIVDSGDVVIRVLDGSAGDEVGAELDLTARWAMRPGVTLQGGYSRFAAGDFVTTTTGLGDQDWAYLQATFGF